MTLSVNIRRQGGMMCTVTSTDLEWVMLGTSASGGPFAEHMEEFLPTPEQWSAFWSSVEECRHWGRKYVDPSVLDGTEWEVEMSHGDLLVSSTGMNAYPVGWSQFMDALQHLIGGRLYL